jgi:hypothetical protein
VRKGLELHVIGEGTAAALDSRGAQPHFTTCDPTPAALIVTCIQLITKFSKTNDQCRGEFVTAQQRRCTKGTLHGTHSPVIVFNLGYAKISYGVCTTEKKNRDKH